MNRLKIIGIIGLAGLSLIGLALPGWASILTTYVRDLNYPDFSVIKPGQKITKSWECRVDSDSDIIKNAYVKVVPTAWDKGQKGLVGPEKPIKVKDTARGVKPGQTFKVSVPILAPKDLPDGQYELDVKLCDSKGRIYTPHKLPLYALLRVKR